MSEAHFRLPREAEDDPTTKGNTDMKYENEVSIDDADHKLLLVKDRSNRAKAGKYANRPKTEKPKNGLVALHQEECKKEPIRDIAICKRRIAQARFTRRAAEAEGRATHRLEQRYYLCNKHSAPQYHLTKLAIEDYAEKVATFAGKGYSLAS